MNGLLLLLAFLIIFPIPIMAYPPLLPSYTLLMPENLGCPGTSVVEAISPGNVYRNPALSVGFIRPVLAQSHSLRHFPLKHREVDQLDADAVGFVFPFGPLAVFRGFSVAGEWGYDYLSLPYEWVEKEKLEGRMESSGLGARLGWLWWGMRSEWFHFRLWGEKTQKDEVKGTAQMGGWVANLLPWWKVGYATVFYHPTKNWKRKEERVFGMSLRLIPWLTWGKEWFWGQYVVDSVPLSLARDFSSVRIRWNPFWFCQGNRFYGVRSFGVSFPFFSLLYAEGAGIMHYLTGMYFPFFRDVHMGGYVVR